MAEPDPIEAYLIRLAELLPTGHPARARILDEVRDHLLLAAEAERAPGDAPGAAKRRAIARFGPPEFVAEYFRRELTDSLVWRESMATTPRPRRCSFCGRDQHQVRRLIAGPGDVQICDKCVALCNEILAKEEQPTPA